MVLSIFLRSYFVKLFGAFSKNLKKDFKHALAAEFGSITVYGEMLQFNMMVKFQCSNWSG